MSLFSVASDLVESLVDGLLALGHDWAYYTVVDDGGKVDFGVEKKQSENYSEDHIEELVEE